jgi:hypothetical protein
MPNYLEVRFFENGSNRLSKVQAGFRRITGSQINNAGNKNNRYHSKQRAMILSGKYFVVQ